MITAQPLFLAVLVLWGVSEASIFAGDLRRVKGTQHDKASRRLIFILLAVGFIAANLAARRHLAPLPGGQSEWQLVGAALVAIGIVIRQWAVRTLGAFFRTRVTILDDHRLITAGPYARIRHPSYTGGLVSMAGVALGYADAAAFVSILGATLLSFANRIRVEEAALSARFGDDYRAYRARTGALLPRVG